MASMNADGINQRLKMQIEELKLERDELKNKLQSLQQLLEKKNKEIEMLRISEGNSPGRDTQDDAAFRQLIERNQRMADELTTLREKLRMMEASGNSSYQNISSNLNLSSKFGR